MGIELIENSDVGIVENNAIRHNAEKVSELIYDYIIDDKPTMIYNKRVKVKQRRRKMHLNFDYSKALNFFNEQEVKNMEGYVKVAHNQLHNKTGIGNDFLGWLELPTNYDKEEFARIKEASKKIQNNSDVLVVIGIGGSYLGARAAIEMLNDSFYNFYEKDRKTPQVFFVGHTISSTYTQN